MKKDYYFKSIQILVQKLINFQKILNLRCGAEVEGSIKILPLEQIMNDVQKIKAIVIEVKRVKSLKGERQYDTWNMDDIIWNFGLHDLWHKLQKFRL